MTAGSKRELVKEAAVEADPGKIHTLFEQSRNLPKAQLATSGRIPKSETAAAGPKLQTAGEGSYQTYEGSPRRTRQ